MNDNLEKTLNEVQGKIEGMEKQKSINDGRIHQLNEERGKVIHELELLGIKKPNELNDVKNELEKDITQLKQNVDDLFTQLPEGVRNEISGVESTITQAPDA